jgi:peptidoglycan-associated lipoprotein
MVATQTEDAMKMTTVALALAALVACSHEKAKVAKPQPIPTAEQPAAKKEALASQVTDDQKVSPTLAISADLVAACGIKAAAQPNPKFDYDKDELTTDDRNILDQLATCLTNGALKGKSVSLIGRADPRGTEEYNLGLGSRRAHTVSTYLGRLGVLEPQLAVTTRGALEASGTDEASWAQDRRVDVQLKQD